MRMISISRLGNGNDVPHVPASELVRPSVRGASARQRASRRLDTAARWAWTRRMLYVAGSPIGGENPPHDKRWRVTIATAATGIDPATAARLDFRIEPHRTVDLDNLARPALAGLRDAGVFARGYRRLDAILATKTPAQTNLGVDIEPTTALAIAAVPRPSNAEVVVAHAGLPRSEHLQSKREWRDSVRRQQRTIDDGPVWIDIAVNTTLSLEGLLKPIIDGLDPVLGMDPSATLEFTANDDRVHWLRIHRQPHLPCPTVLAAGPMTLVTQPGRPLEYRGYQVSSDCESDQVLPYRGRMFPHTLDP